MTNPINLPSAHRDALKNELANNYDAAPVNRVLADPEITLDEMRGLSSDEKAKFRSAMNAQKSVIGDAAVRSLEALLAEAEKKSSTKPSVATEKPREISYGSTAVQEAASGAMSSLKSALEPSGQPPAEFLSGWREVKAKIPGMEVGGLAEIKDALNQSRQYNKDLINYLVAESAKPDLSLSLSSWPFSNRPGMFLSFADDKFSSVEEKQKAIVNALNNLESLWKNQGPDAIGMGVWGWATVVIGFYLGKKLIWNGGRAVIGSVKWFGIGSAAVSVMDAVGGAAKERADQAKGILDTAARQREASLSARGTIDPAGADFKEFFDVGERTIRGNTSITDAEKARRFNALGRLQADYISSFESRKVPVKFIGSKFRAEVGYIVDGNLESSYFAKGDISSAVKHSMRNMPVVGRFFQGGLIGALNTADGLKTGSSLDPIEIMGESFEFKDATTRNNVETIWELSRQRGKLLRIQEKLTELSNQKTLETQLKTQLDATPKTIDLQTETQITTLHSTNNVANQQPATQIMKRQEVNPEYIKTLDEYNKARNAGLALTRELTTVNPNKLDQARVSNEIELKNVAIEGKLVDLRIAYPSAQVLEYDRNNKGINIDKWVHRLAKNLKR